MSLMFMLRSSSSSFFFFFNDTATTEIYTLSLHDALPILQKIRSATLAQIDDQQKKIDSSKTEVAKAANLERQAKDSMARFAALKAMSPEGAPIAWFPPRVKTFFANQGIDRAIARLESNTNFKQTELAAWTKYNWLIERPQPDFASLGH